MAIIDGILGELEDAPTPSEPEGTAIQFQPDQKDHTLDLLNDAIKQQKRAELGFSLTQAIDVNPDEHAEAAELSKTVGLSPDLVRQDLPSARKQAKQGKINYDLLLDKNQKLAEAMSDPEFAKLAHDDFEPLKEIENIFKAQWEGLTHGQAVNQLGRLGSEEAFGQLNEEQKVRSLELQERMKHVPEYDGIAYVANTTAEIVGQMIDSFSHTISETAKGSIVGQLAQGEFDEKALMTSMAPGGPVANYLKDIFDIEAGHFFLDVKDLKDADGNPLEPELAQGGAMVVGGINAALEAIGLGFIGKPIMSGVRNVINDTTKDVLQRATTSTAVKSFLKAYATAWAGETGTEIAQENVNMGVEAAIKGMSKGEFEQIDLEEYAERNLEIFKKVGTGMAILALPGASINFASDLKDVQTAKRNQEFMEALGDSAKASELKKRAPKQFQQFIDEVMKDGPVENVRIPVDKFDEYFQTAEIDMEELLAELPGVAEQLDQARQLGGEIIIPINEYAAKIAPTEHHAGLMQDIRFNPTEMTPREAAEMMERAPEILEEYIQVEKDRLDAAEQDNDVRDRLYEAAQKMQIEGGESPTISAPRSKLLSEWFATVGGRYKLDAFEEFRKRGIEVRGPFQQEAPKTEDLDILIDRVRFGKAPTQKELYGPSLLEMFAKRGGLKDEGGELSARDAQKWHIGRGMPKFVTDTGLSLDGAREIAIDEGYLPEGSTLDDLLALVTDEMAGEPVYAEQNIDRAAADIQAENQALIDFLAQKGIDFATATNQEIKDALQGVEAERADIGGMEYKQVDISDLSLVEHGDFKTGEPVTFNFLHNTESATEIFGAPDIESPYDRGYEPSGRYMIATDELRTDAPDQFVSGEITFNNPIVIDTKTWKRELSDKFGGKTGKELSAAIIGAGYDGVVTISTESAAPYTSEILDLTTFDYGRALYQAITPTSEITVKVKAIEAETGREMTIDQKADEALQETNEAIATLERLAECLAT